MGFSSRLTWSHYVSIRRISAGNGAAVQKDGRWPRHLLPQTRFFVAKNTRKRPAYCRIRAMTAKVIAASFQTMPVTSHPRDRVWKQDLDQRAGTAAGLDL